LFQWHSSKSALKRLSPPWNPIEVLYDDGNIKDYAKKELKIKAGLFKYNWKAVHSDYQKNHFFRDTQIKGPFRYWSHYHKFIPDTFQKCVLEDEIEYIIPFSFPGNIFLRKFIEKELNRIFSYRHVITARDIKMHQFYKNKKNMTILISGSSGILGSALIPFLTTGGHTVIKLVRQKIINNDEVYWNPEKGEVDIDKIGKIDAVINLSGENIGNGKWTKAKKDNIIKSRLDSSKLICRIIESIKPYPKVFLSASAIGYYGNTGDIKINEYASQGKSFISEVCKIWEKAASSISKKSSIRTVFMRIGVVLTPAGGALKKLTLPFKLGVGFKIGKGSQYMSWIGIEDFIGSVYHLLQKDSIEGPINIVSPNPVTNYQFSQILGKILSRPTIFTIPPLLIEAFFKDMGKEVLLEGCRVMPEKLINSGYNFIHTDLANALKESLGL